MWRFAFAALTALTALPAAALPISITTNTNWSAITSGTGGGQPTSSDTITVSNGATLTVDVADGQVGAMTLGGTGAGTLRFNAGSKVTIAGGTGILTLGASGKTNVGTLNMASGGTLVLNGFTSTNPGTFTPGSGTVELRGTNTLPSAYTTYNNLTITSNTTTLGAATTVGGNLIVNGTLTVNNTLTVTGTTTVGGILSMTTTSAKTFTGTVTLNSGSSWCVASTQCNAATLIGGTILLGSNFSNSATTFLGGSAAAAYTFNGTALQTLSGSNASTTLPVVALTNANGLSLGGTHDLIVSTSLNLSAGKVTTGAANTVYVSSGSAIAGVGTGRFVEGNLKKPFSSASLTRAFEVGGNSSSNYSPVNITFASVGTAGDITVSTTSGMHGQLSNNSGIDTAQKLARWWTITNGGVGFTSYSATFTYVGTGATGEIDAGSNAAAFRAVRYDGSDWNAATVSTIPTITTLSISGESGFGDFAIGESLEYNINRGSASLFTALDTGTPTGALHGNIGTKVAGTSFTLRLVHLNATGTALASNATFSAKVELVDASSTTGSYTNNCLSSWTPIYDSGTVTNLFTNAGGPTVNYTFPSVTNSWPNVRVRITRMPGSTEVGCSSDRFAIRPNDLLVEAADSDWQNRETPSTSRPLHNTGASGGNVHAASTSGAASPKPFTLKATARNSSSATTTNYAGSPTQDGSLTLVLPVGGNIGNLSFGPTWAASSGVVTTDAHYSEVGAFAVKLKDRTFANVDIADTSLANRTILQAAPTPRQIGRFVPDRFDFVSATTPVLQTFGASCASTRSFTYVGKSFGYVTLPSATLQALNAGGAVTTNYRGVPPAGLFKLTASDLVETYSNNAVGPTVSCKKSDLTAPCSAAGTPATLNSSANDGTALYTAPSNTVLVYTRDTSTPASAYNAKISLSVVATDTSETGTGNPGTTGLTTPSPLIFDGGGPGIGFDGGDFNTLSGLTGGKTFVYGRLRMVNAFGSHTVALPVGIETQYWNGSAFQTNTQDNCTTLAKANIRLSDYRPNLDPCETEVSPATATITFIAGAGRLYLTAPGTAALTAGSTPVAGSVLLTAQLASSTPGTDQYCNGGAQTDTTNAGKDYLQGAWTGATYNEDPSARGTFGFYGAQPRNFIYFRENY